MTENQVGAHRLAVVTGGLGGLGTVICQQLADAGRNVIAINLGGSAERIAAFASAMNGRDAEFLSADDPGFITGANLPVNGGLFIVF